MSELKLRYYSDYRKEKEHEKTLSLLRQISNKYDINVEVERVSRKHGPIGSFTGKVRKAELEEVYDRDFDRNRSITKNVGEQPSDAFKTNSGRITIRGSVAVIKDDLVWASSLGGSKQDSDSLRYTNHFLQHVLADGTDAIESVCTVDGDSSESGKPDERQVINEFVNSGFIAGKMNREVSVGGSLATPEDAGGAAARFIKNSSSRSADIIIETGEKHWVVEAKREYDAGKFDKAIGQVISSAELYREENDLEDSDVVPAVLLGTSPDQDWWTGRDVTFIHMTEYLSNIGIQVLIRTGKNKFANFTEDITETKNEINSV